MEKTIAPAPSCSWCEDRLVHWTCRAKVPGILTSAPRRHSGLLPALPTYLPTSIPTYLGTYLPIFLPLTLLLPRSPLHPCRDAAWQKRCFDLPGGSRGPIHTGWWGWHCTLAKFDLGYLIPVNKVISRRKLRWVGGGDNSGGIWLGVRNLCWVLLRISCSCFNVVQMECSSCKYIYKWGIYEESHCDMLMEVVYISCEKFN